MDMFEFLEPWRAILRDVLQRDDVSNDAAKSVVSLSFIPLDRLPESCSAYALTVRFPVDETSRREKKRLQKIREAVELFTTLSMVNNKAFKKMAPMPTWINAADEHRIYPRWEFWIRGTLVPTDPATMQSPVTWGTLLGISDHPSLSSPDFREAALKLESMGYEKTSEVFIRSRFGISWEIKVRGTHIKGRQELEESAAVRAFQTLLDIDVPPIVQVYFTEKCDTLMEIWQQTHASDTPCSFLSTEIRNFTESIDFPEMAVALARTTISDRFHLDFENYDSAATDNGGTIDSPQVVRNVGVLLSTLLCGRSLCNGPGDNCCSSPIICRAKHGELNLTCYPMASDRVFIGMCSAVAEMLPEIRLARLDVNCTNPARWSWLAYALCCGGSNLALSTLVIQRSTATKNAMLAIAETLRVFYPTVPKQNCTSVYGFVEIREGTELWPCDFEDRSENAVLIASSTYRCRARMDPSSDGFVEIIVPGYGACQTKLDDNIHFTPDTGNSGFQKKRLCKRLDWRFDTTENVELVMDLLQLLFSEICELELIIHNNGNANLSLDLRILAAVCPALRKFISNKFNVVVSAHTEALQKWPIEDMRIRYTETVSDVLLCLRNPALRMARQLVCLWVAPHPNREFTEDEVREIKSLDGEYLPVMMEKLPAQSKAALISVVLSGFTTSHSTKVSKAMHHLDANVLSLIFVFASTPAQRSVQYLAY